MTNLQKAYIAGIVDGEGYIAFTKQNCIYIKVKMTHKETILYLKQASGLGSVYDYDPRIRPERSHYKLLYIWKVTFKQALLVLNEILPYLITKKDDAERALKLDSEHKAKKLKRGFYQPL